jgi:hypothetical protein
MIMAMNVIEFAIRLEPAARGVCQFFGEDPDREVSWASPEGATATVAQWQTVADHIVRTFSLQRDEADRQLFLDICMPLVFPKHPTFVLSKCLQ